MKRTISITLDTYDAQLLDKAVRLACSMRGDGDEPENSNRRFVLRWIILAVCSAIIRKGAMPKQLAVELRHESPEEMRQRLEGIIPASPHEPGHRIPPPNSWN